jgi:hypothetical protein
MSKKTKSVEDHLQDIKYLLAGILLKKEIDIGKAAKIVSCRKQTLTAMYPK